MSDRTEKIKINSNKQYIYYIILLRHYFNFYIDIENKIILI